jgi:nitrite reductase/ring-hydroxylating ferredoxin subunit
VRQGRTLHAWRNSCPHIPGTPLPWRKDAYLNQSRDRIVCAAHGAQFEIATGVCVLGPCFGASLEPIPVSLTHGGDVLIDFSQKEATR